MEITKESLLEYGMIETKGDESLLFPMKKVISVKNHLDEEMEEDEDGELAICITRLRNQVELCLSMPDGSILYLAPKSIEDLQAFERCIESYEPVF
mgnify:FL=1